MGGGNLMCLIMTKIAGIFNWKYSANNILLVLRLDVNF